MATTPSESLLTAEQYLRSTDFESPSELVRGSVSMMNPPTPLHGRICFRVAQIVAEFVESRDLGQVMTNDSAVITGRDPDTVRGADVAYYSYTRLPKGKLDAGYVDVAPDAIFEVRSPYERWSKLLTKIAEYLEVGVQMVCVLDPPTETIQVYYPDRPTIVLTSADALTLPDLFSDFSVPVSRFFR